MNKGYLPKTSSLQDYYYNYEMKVYTCVLRNQVGKPQTAHAEPLSRVHYS